MRAAPTLCLLAALAGCNFPDPDLRPAPPRRAAFGEATVILGFAGAERIAAAGPSLAWSANGGIKVNWIEPPVVENESDLFSREEMYWGIRDARDPALAAGGAQLVCVMRGGGDSGSRLGSSVYVIDGGAQRTRRLVAESNSELRHPCFSPDGLSVVWDDSSTLRSQLWIADLRSSMRTFVTEGSSPTWSPDGQWIAFESGTPPSIYKVRPDGSDRTRLTDNRDTRRPTWSPDSLWIAFGQFDADGHADDIWAVRADGSRFLRVTWDPAPEWDPCWAPDGRVLFTTIRNGTQGIWAVAPENTELLK